MVEYGVERCNFVQFCADFLDFIMQNSASAAERLPTPTTCYAQMVFHTSSIFSRQYQSRSSAYTKVDSNLSLRAFDFLIVTAGFSPYGPMATAGFSSVCSIVLYSVCMPCVLQRGIWVCIVYMCAYALS